MKIFHLFSGLDWVLLSLSTPDASFFFLFSSTTQVSLALLILPFCVLVGKLCKLKGVYISVKEMPIAILSSAQFVCYRHSLLSSFSCPSCHLLLSPGWPQLPSSELLSCQLLLHTYSVLIYSIYQSPHIITNQSSLLLTLVLMVQLSLPKVWRKTLFLFNDPAIYLSVQNIHSRLVLLTHQVLFIFIHPIILSKI